MIITPMPLRLSYQHYARKLVMHVFCFWHSFSVSRYWSCIEKSLRPVTIQITLPQLLISFLGTISCLPTSRVNYITKLEEASTHKSATSHASNFFVTHNRNNWHFDPDINEFSGFILERFCSYLVILIAWVFEILQKETHRQMEVKNPTPTTAVGVGNKQPFDYVFFLFCLCFVFLNCYWPSYT